MKQNTAPEYIVSVGLNEDADSQSLEFSQLNEIRDNRVVNTFPFLKPRSAPYAALVVSSSRFVQKIFVIKLIDYFNLNFKKCLIYNLPI